MFIRTRRLLEGGGYFTVPFVNAAYKRGNTVFYFFPNNNE